MLCNKERLNAGIPYLFTLLRKKNPWYSPVVSPLASLLSNKMPGSIMAVDGKQCNGYLMRLASKISRPGGTGTQMGGWFKQEINTLADLQHIKMRIPGLGGRVMEQLGVETALLSGGDVVEALKTGLIDAAEWIGPHDDEILGLNQVADFYYYPGWWEPGTTSELLVNRAAWDELPLMYQEILRTATYEANSVMLSQYEVLNQAALARLVAGGTQLRAYSEEILVAARNVAFELYEEIASKNILFREIFENWKKFRRDIYQWNRFNELTFTRFATEGIF